MANKLKLVKTVKDEGKSAFKGEHLSEGNLGQFLAEADKGSYRGHALETYGSNAYSAKLKERLLKAWAVKRSTASRERATTSLVPSWLKAKLEEEIEVIPERAAVVKKIFHLASVIRLECGRTTRSPNSLRALRLRQSGRRNSKRAYQTDRSGAPRGRAPPGRTWLARPDPARQHSGEADQPV